MGLTKVEQQAEADALNSELGECLMGLMFFFFWDNLNGGNCLCPARRVKR